MGCYRCGCSTACCTCNSTPCTPVVNCPDIATALTVNNSWNVPACGATAVLSVVGLTTVLLGTYLSNPTYGTYQITAFDSVNGQLTVINNCYVENAAPGSIVPSGTKFIISATPGTGVTSSWTPVLTASGAMTVTAQVVNQANYWAVGVLRFFMLEVDFTLGGVVATTINVPLPTAAISTATNIICNAQENGVAVTNGGRWNVIGGNPGTLIVVKPATANWVLGTMAGLSIQGFYRAS